MLNFRVLCTVRFGESINSWKEVNRVKMKLRVVEFQPRPASADGKYPAKKVAILQPVDDTTCVFETEFDPTMKLGQPFEGDYSFKGKVWLRKHVTCE